MSSIPVAGKNMTVADPASVPKHTDAFGTCKEQVILTEIFG